MFYTERGPEGMPYIITENDSQGNNTTNGGKGLWGWGCLEGISKHALLIGVILLAWWLLTRK